MWDPTAGGFLDSPGNMIEDEDHPHFVAAQEEFMRRATFILRQHRFVYDQALLRALDDMARQLRNRMRREGVDFPYLTALMLEFPRAGWRLFFYRADLDAEGVRNAVLQTLRECVARGWTLPSPAAVVAGVVAAWPQIRQLPKFDIADEGEHVATHDQERLAVVH